MKSGRMFLISALFFTAVPAFADIVDDAFSGANDMTSRALGLAKVVSQIATTQMPKAQRDPLLDKLGLALKRLYQVSPGDMPGVVGNADDMAIGQALETYATSAVGYGAAMVKLITGRVKDLDAIQDPRARQIGLANFINKLIARLKLMFDTDDVVRAQFDAVKIDDKTTADQILTQYAQIAQAIIVGVPKDTLLMVSAFKINAMVAEIIKRTGLVVGNSPCEANSDKDNRDKQTQAAQSAETAVSGLFNQKNASKPQDYADVVKQIIMGLKSDFLFNRPQSTYTIRGEAQPSQEPPSGFGGALNALALEEHSDNAQIALPQERPVVGTGLRSNDQYKPGDNPYQSYFAMIATDKILLGWITPPAVPDNVDQGDMWQVDIMRMPGDPGPRGMFWANSGTLVFCHAPALQTPDKTSCICPKDGVYIMTSNSNTNFNMQGNPTLKDYMCTKVGQIGEDAPDGFFWTGNTEGNVSQLKCVGTSWRTPDKKGCGCTRKYDWYVPKIRVVGSDTIDWGPLGVLKVSRTQLDCAPMTVDDFLDAQEKGYCVNQHNNQCVQGRMFEGITEALKVAKWATWTEAQKQRALMVVKKVMDTGITYQNAGIDPNQLKQLDPLTLRTQSVRALLDIVTFFAPTIAATGDQDALKALLMAPKMQLIGMIQNIMHDPELRQLQPSRQQAILRLINDYRAYLGSPDTKAAETVLNVSHADVMNQFELVEGVIKRVIGAQ